MTISLVHLQATILLHFELPRLSNLAAEQELMLSRWLEQFTGDMTEYASSLNEKEDSEHLEALASDIQEREEHYPQYMRRSTFLISYGGVEAGLHSLAKAAFKDGLNEQEPATRSFHLADAKRYFRSGPTASSNMESSWRDLNGYRRVRNVIAHNAGQANPNDPEYSGLVSFLKGRDDASISSASRIVLEEPWCVGFVDVAEKVLTGIATGLARKRGA